MVNQQPWIADASHNAMHQPAGPEIVPRDEARMRHGLGCRKRQRLLSSSLKNQNRRNAGPTLGERHEPVRHEGKSRRHHRLDARHRPRHRRADGRARRQGRDLLAQAGRLRPGDQGDQRQVRQGHRGLDRRQHLQQGKPAAPRRRIQPRLRQDRRAGLQRRVEPVLRAARRHLRRPVPQDPRQQHRRQQLADQRWWCRR